MNNTLEGINSSHGFSIKKEDLKSFSNIKQYLDKLLHIILRNSPVIMTTLESQDKYNDNNENYIYTKCYFQTFKGSDDGFDDISNIKTIRYLNLLEHILYKLNLSNLNLNLMDIVETKPNKMFSCLTNLSMLSKFVLEIMDYINQMMHDIQIEKIENAKSIENIKIRQLELLTNDYNYEELVDMQKNRYRQFLYFEEQIDMKTKFLSEKRSQIDILKFELERKQIYLVNILENIKERVAGNKKLIDNLKYDPKRLNDELSKLLVLFNKEKEKCQENFQICNNLKHSYKHLENCRPIIELYMQNSKIHCQTLETYELINKKQQSLICPELELQNQLQSVFENKLNINKKIQEKINSTNEKLSQLKNGFELIEHSKTIDEQREILRLNMKNFLKEQEKINLENKEICEIFKKNDLNYLETIKNIENNFRESTNELKRLLAMCIQ